MLCVGHEIAPDGHVEEAEIIIGGYSFCYPCGNGVLGDIVAGSLQPVEKAILDFKSGERPVSPRNG